MQTVIIKKLEEIALEYGVCILFACESGSRGWQFPSPDSDYDVRFIYVRQLNDYLSVARYNELQIGLPINDELDMYGWDIRKVLGLIRKSNTTPFEWLQSPIVYMQQPQFRDELWTLCEKYFDRFSNIRHYLGIARSAMNTMVNNSEITIKKLFYVLRPLLAAKWCLEQNSIAPMSIHPLMSLMPGNLQLITNDLINCKATTPEGYLVNIEPELKVFIDSEFEACTQASVEKSSLRFEVEPLDIFFRKMIKRNDSQRN